MSSELLNSEIEQYRIANWDLMWCQKFLVAYIELMHKPEAGIPDPWIQLSSREYGDEIKIFDILARSLCSSIIVSYSRPWSGNKDLAGAKRNFPARLLTELNGLMRRDDPSTHLLPFHKPVHEKVLGLRHKVIAHSDASDWGTVPHTTEEGFEGTKSKDPFVYLTVDEARELIDNTKAMRSQAKFYARRVRGEARK